jgi:hypothetical protein
MSPAVEEVPGGVLVKVRAAPGASRDGVAGLHGNALKVRVTAPPERGKANAAIARVLAEALGVRASTVRVHRGEASRDKWVLVEGLDLADLRARLAALG